MYVTTEGRVMVQNSDRKALLIYLLCFPVEEGAKQRDILWEPTSGDPHWTVYVIFLSEIQTTVGSFV